MSTNAGTSVNASAASGGGQSNIITALGQVFKMQTGDTMSGEKIAQMLIANMGQLGELAKQGKLTHQQITQVRAWEGCAVFFLDPMLILGGSYS